MTTKQALAIRAMWAEGKSAKAIAYAIGLDVYSVYYYALRNRDVCPYRRVAISEDDKAKMRLLRDQGMSYADIAKAVGCGISTVRRHTRKKA